MTPPPEVRSDFCGIFLIKSADDVKRILTVESFLRGSRLEMHPKGQGYPYSRQLQGRRRSSSRDLLAQPGSVRHHPRPRGRQRRS